MRILMSMFGWNDSGGGTILPRLTALELQKRGHEVLVIYSAVPQIPNTPAYQIHEHSDEGVQLIGIHNRPALFMDDKNPERELNDPRVVEIFKHFFDAFKPDIVHYHNFLGLSLGITNVAYEAGVPSFYTPYNFWLLCPTLYLNLPNLALCQGVNADGSNCLQCTQARHKGAAYIQRRNQLRDHFQQQVGPCLASSQCVKNLLIDNGYSEDQVEILKFANERSAKIWQEAGADRTPHIPETIKIGFTGSVIPIKGVHTLVAAAQLLTGPVEILIYGNAPEQYLTYLKNIDIAQRVQFKGFFADEDHSQILAELSLAVVPSVCYDHSPLVIGEFLAARTPVIGANIGGIPDYIPEGCGELFEAGNAEDLACVLQKYIDKPDLIPGLQKNIQEPLSFDDYVSVLEKGYQETLIIPQTHILRSWYKRWLNQREKTQFYHAEKLYPLSKEMIKVTKEPYGLDLWNDLESIDDDLVQKAKWIVGPVSSQEIYEKRKKAWSLKYHVLPFLPTLTTRFSLDFGEVSTLRYLLPVSVESESTYQFLKNYIQAPVDPECELILIPWGQSFEASETLITKWLETLPETLHELTLIDPPSTEQELQSLLYEVGHLILTDSSIADVELQGLTSLCREVISSYPLILDNYWEALPLPPAFSIFSGGGRWVQHENALLRLTTQYQDLQEITSFFQAHIDSSA